MSNSLHVSGRGGGGTELTQPGVEPTKTCLGRFLKKQQQENIENIVCY